MANTWLEATTNNPVVALFMGILITTLVQSSSTTTSLIVASVVGGLISVEAAIYMVMGANVGTTVTNTIVSLGHITRTNEYRRAFAAATVHDIFNLIVLIVIFPIEVIFSPLRHLAEGLTASTGAIGIDSFASPIKVITAPAKDLIKSFANLLANDANVQNWIILGISLVLMFGMLIALVRALKALMIHRLENLFDRTIFKTPYRSVSFGLVLTILVQSSSVTTCLAVPLVGAGVLTVRQVFPYTMGANIGTTCTGILAALGAMADSPDDPTATVGLTVAFFHVMFNVAGVLLVWPIRELPVRIAQAFAGLAMRNRIIPVIYIGVTFYIVPFLIVTLGAK